MKPNYYEYFQTLTEANSYFTRYKKIKNNLDVLKTYTLDLLSGPVIIDWSLKTALSAG